jgi:hypothetical protein
MIWPAVNKSNSPIKAETESGALRWLWIYSPFSLNQLKSNIEGGERRSGHLASRGQTSICIGNEPRFLCAGWRQPPFKRWSVFVRAWQQWNVAQTCSNLVAKVQWQTESVFHKATCLLYSICFDLLKLHVLSKLIFLYKLNTKNFTPGRSDKKK